MKKSIVTVLLFMGNIFGWRIYNMTNYTIEYTIRWGILGSGKEENHNLEPNSNKAFNENYCNWRIDDLEVNNKGFLFKNIYMTTRDYANVEKIDDSFYITHHKYLSDTNYKTTKYKIG